jgi:hypothetical protein
LNEIRSAGVTAFDLFGILLPGVLLLVAVRIGLVPFNGPITSSFEQFGYATWIALLVLSYICGHLAQLIGRAVSRLLTLVFPWGEVFRLSVNQPDQRETALALYTVRSYLHYRTGIDVRNLSDVVLSNLTDEFVEQYGNAATLANFRSREVYYRGLAGGMLVLGTAFAICAVWGETPFTSLPPMSPQFANVVLSLVCLIMAAAGDAYRRQRRRRMRHSLISYLALETGGRLLHRGQTLGSPVAPAAGSDTGRSHRVRGVA